MKGHHFLFPDTKTTATRHRSRFVSVTTLRTQKVDTDTHATSDSTRFDLIRYPFNRWSQCNEIHPQTQLGSALFEFWLEMLKFRQIRLLTADISWRPTRSDDQKFRFNSITIKLMIGIQWNSPSKSSWMCLIQRSTRIWPSRWWRTPNSKCFDVCRPNKGDLCCNTADPVQSAVYLLEKYSNESNESRHCRHEIPFKFHH